MLQMMNSQSRLPNASNIDFVFDLNSQKLLYLNDWINSLIPGYKQDLESLWSIIHEDDRDSVNLACKQFLSGEMSGNVKFRIISTSGEIWLSVTPFVQLNTTQPTIFGNIINISDEVENFSSISRYANKKNSVLHMLAHDLRGPLSIANSLISVLEKDLNQPTSLNKTRAISSIIQQSIELISDLINREFLETVEAALVKKRIDIVKKIGEYIDECKRSAQIADRNFVLTSSSQMIQIAVDEAKFMQIINNLLSNALKFTNANGTLSIHIEDHSDRVEVVFSDDGIGIPAHLMPHIFDQFTASKRVGIHGEPTTGLGLSIVKEVMAWHNGSIECTSTEGQGTAFTITFPKDLNDAIGDN